jgi:hypothetical protein
MSRDPHAPRGPGAPPPAGEPVEPREDDAELLTAYIDGVAELSPAERRRVEARLAGDPATRADRAAVRTLIDQLRALPPEGAEPDWAAMERSIRRAVGPAGPRPWWRSWRWLTPVTMLATSAAMLLVMWARPAPIRAPEATTATGPGTGHLAREARPAEDTVALWLDGVEVDVELSASDLLGDAEAGDPVEPASLVGLLVGPSGPIDDDDLGQPGGEADAELGLLPSTDLAWIDQLDEAAIDRAERWFAGKKG